MPTIDPDRLLADLRTLRNIGALGVIYALEVVRALATDEATRGITKAPRWSPHC